MVRFVGTSHVSKESTQRIKSAFEERIPAIVAIELDAERLNALIQKQPSGLSLHLLRRVGLSGYLFALFGSWFQQYLGKKTGVLPGAEMLHAINLAKIHNLPVILIDRPLQTTLAQFSKHFSMKERLRLVRDLIIPSKMLRIDVTKIPEEALVEQVVGVLKRRYPGVYRALIAERDAHMARRIITIQDQDALIIVGAAHIPGIKARLRIEL